jgi:hypothetical protein
VESPRIPRDNPCPKESDGQADTLQIIFFLKLLLFGM